MTVTFFGHRDTPQTIRPALEKLLTELIEKEGARIFYVGHQGAFDAIVLQTLKWLRPVYPEISFFVVLAYMPFGSDDPHIEHAKTVFPWELDCVPRRYALDRRNRWMVDEADVVVTYAPHTFGGAAKFKALALRKGKRVIELSEMM